MKTKIIFAIGIVAFTIVFFISQSDKTIEEEGNKSVQSAVPQISDKSQIDSDEKIKISSPEKFKAEIKLNESEKKFLLSFSKTESDLVIAQAVLLSRHAPSSPKVDDLRKAVFLNPQTSINSIAKFINDQDLDGFELEKSALLSLGEQIALYENSKRTLIEASRTELYKMVNALPELASDNSSLRGPEAEMNFIQSLGKENANKLASAVSYFKKASEGIDGVAEQKDVVNLIKEITNPILKNILARNYYESNKEKLSSEDISDLKEAGVNYDGYAKSPN
jgi:hypothetical protein